MINPKYRLINSIFIVIFGLIVVALMLWQFIEEGIITKDNLLSVYAFIPAMPYLAIFNKMAYWIKNKTLSSSIEACEAVLSFFVQHCEVFREISK